MAETPAAFGPGAPHPTEPVAPGTAPPPAPPRRRWDARMRQRVLGVAWVVAVLAGLALVVYGFGPVLESREQARLARVEKAAINRAANEGTGLAGTSAPTHAPAPGAPVAILEIGAVRFQQVVVEGAGSTETQAGPGHVMGTAGLGQPGNSVVVGRARAFGGPLRALGKVKKGATILVTTTQGQSVYVVDSVARRALHRTRGVDGEPAASPSPPTTPASNDSSLEAVYGPSTGDRLTIVTSGSPMPWNTARAIVVVASLQGRPFVPTPQNGRLDSGQGPDGDRSAGAATVLAMVLFGTVMSASVMLYRRVRPATAYILTIGPVMASTIIAAETLSRLFPAWT